MIVAVIGAMAIVAMLLGLTVTADYYVRAQADKERAARLAAAALKAAGDLKAFGRAMEGTPVSAWALVSPEGILLAWSEPSRAAGIDRKQALERIGPDSSVGVPGRGKLYLRIQESGGGILSRLSSGATALAVGTVLVVVVAYMLLAALVVRPIERLVQATRALSAGAGQQKVVGESRADEIGELIRSFNRMAEEVRSHREELEGRVKEATREYDMAQKRLALGQRLASTGRLAAGIAHEINNPLGGMLNAARSIEKTSPEGSRPREYAHLIIEGLERISQMVSRMLQFHRQKPEVRSVDISSVLKEALAFCEHRVEKEGVELRLDAPAGLIVQGDKGELQQVFLNLFVNALDAVGNSARKRLRVHARREGKDLVIDVADTGKGLTEEEMEHAFDLFYTTKDSESGTGLGLAIVHTTVTNHGGRVALQSEPGGGTRAVVVLPAEEKE